MVFDSSPGFCNTSLSLGLGSIDTIKNDPQNHDHVTKSSPKSFPSLTLALPSDHHQQQKTSNMDHHQSSIVHGSGQQQASSGSAVSSFSNSSSVKREIREVISGADDQDLEEERASAKHNMVDQEQDEEGPRKKLRLTKEQAFVLEESFKEHSTLNPKQKQALANKLSLRPRQVEVWFQNRRARTKLKQTEVDFEILKKCCDTLKEENKRLHKELQELKAVKLAAVPPTPFYMQLPAATLSMCPSCETISAASSGGASGGSGESSSRLSFSIGGKSHFYNPFANHPSAAC